MFRKDNLVLGIVLGFIAPLLGILIHYFVVFYELDVSLPEYLGLFKNNTSLLTAVSSISLIANAIIFTLYINNHRDKTAKGIFLATLIYGIGVLLIKVIR
jgi:hypothetical protein